MTDERKQLSDLIRSFPRMPGVYLMRDGEKKVIYVGKAKDLRARVRSYFLGKDERHQVRYLLQRVVEIDKIVTGSEHEALVLERDLITKYKPRYNIRLKDDKAFLSIRIDEHAEWPRLELVRKRFDDGARYFGPYSFSYELRTLLDIIKRTIPLRTCLDTVFYNRARPCLEYQIKRCAGPCCLAVDPAQYRRWVKQAISILDGRVDDLVRELTQSMEKASSELRFEEAAILRDRVEILKNFKSGTGLISSRGESRDVFQLYREDERAVLTVVTVRGGRVADSTNFTFTDLQMSDEELLESALTQYYGAGKEIPEEVLVPCALDLAESIEQELRTKRGSAMTLVVPQRGIRSRLLDLALINAREHFVTTFDAESRAKELAEKIARLFRLSQVPRRIECVDISNFQGSDTVGAIVAFFDGAPDKRGYRRFKLSGYSKPDDFAAVQEVVGRRLERGRAEGDLPDLLIIDGGPGQLAMALEARDSLGISLDIVSLAKMRTERDVASTKIVKSSERVYLEGADEPVVLEDGAEVTRFMQRIRDETHRFVITFHRARRKKRVIASALDTIAGISRERRARLLKSFGSIEAIARQSADEVAKAGRMPLALAQKVLQALQEKAVS